MTTEFFVSSLRDSPVIAILRGLSPEATVRMAVDCWDRGIRLVEVPLQSDEAAEALRSAAEHANGVDRLIGAGTVCTPDETDRALDAGARFIVAPGLFPDAIERAHELELPVLPGVQTPTEIHAALSLGLDVLKLFPAGLSALATLRGPFPAARFVAVGGVTVENAQAFMDAGAIGIGVGSALADPSTLESFSQLRPSTTLALTKEN